MPKRSDHSSSTYTAGEAAGVGGRVKKLLRDCSLDDGRRTADNVYYYIYDMKISCAPFPLNAYPRRREKVSIARVRRHWEFETESHGSGQADSLAAATKAVGRRIGTPPGQSVGIQWSWADDLITEAISIHETRVQLRAQEKRFGLRTRESAIRMVNRGLSLRDISQLLGISIGLVSRLTSTAALFGDETDLSSTVQIVDLHTDDGVVTRHGYGDLPDELEHEGQTYRATGGSHQVGGCPWKHSYAPVGSSPSS